MLGLLLVLKGSVVRGHGWYDGRCCSDRDCAPLPPDTLITPVLGGYAITLGPNGRRVFFSRDKVKPSHDERYHACLSASGTPFCIYVPLGS